MDALIIQRPVSRPKKASKDPGPNYRKASGAREYSRPLARPRRPFELQAWPFLWSGILAVGAMIGAVASDMPILFGILPLLLIACSIYVIYGRSQLRKRPRIRATRRPSAEEFPPPLPFSLASKLPPKPPAIVTANVRLAPPEPGGKL